MNERLESIVVQDLIPDVIMMFHFLDALASLDFKLSVTQSVTYRFLQLAHLRVFQSYFSKVAEGLSLKLIEYHRRCSKIMIDAHCLKVSSS